MADTTQAGDTPKLPPELQSRKDQADVDKAVADAAKAAADARKAAIDAQKALLPDLSKLDAPSLTVKDGASVGGGSVTFGAVEAAARLVAAAIESRLTTPTAPGGSSSGADDDRSGRTPVRRILVTNEEDLASLDASHAEVAAGEELIGAAQSCVKSPVETRREIAGGLLALASVIPVALSLLTTRRTIGSSSATVSDLAATAAVVDAPQDLSGLGTTELVHSNFRLLPTDGPTLSRLAELGRARAAVAAHRLALEETVARIASDRDHAKDLEKRISEADPHEKEALTKELEEVQRRILEKSEAAAGSDARLAMMTVVLDAIDGFGNAIRTVPSTGRSMLANAILHDGLHGEAPAFANVLLVKSQNGSVLEATADRPLWFEDKFMSVADVSISYMLLDTKTSRLVASGTKTGTHTLRGTIGDRLTITAAEAVVEDQRR